MCQTFNNSTRQFYDISLTFHSRNPMQHGWIYLLYHSQSQHGILDSTTLTFFAKTLHHCLTMGLYSYQVLPMGLATAPDVFQGRMSTIFGNLPFVNVYLDDILIITKHSFQDHLDALQQVMQCLRNTIYKYMLINPPSVLSRQSILVSNSLEMEYFRKTRKNHTILDIAPPKTVKQAHSFLGAINHYKLT